MEEIRIISLSVADLQKIVETACDKVVQKVKEQESAPSEYEDIPLEQAATELRCSVRTIRRRMKELNIKGFRVGKEITIQRKDLKKIKKAS